MLKLKFSLQIASSFAQVPSKAQFKKWAKAALLVDTEVTIRVVDAEEALTLNNTYCGKNYATNVLTFALTEEPILMGDIIICAPVVAAEAVAQNKPLEAHYAHLTVHGMLHLSGFDHEDEHQAELMEGLEIQILTKLGYANPYIITEGAA